VKIAKNFPSGFIKFCHFDYLAFHEAHRSMSLVVSVPKNGRRKYRKKILHGKVHKKFSRKTNNMMAGRRPEGCITDLRNTRLQETSWGRE
jgi:hypothetical protein